MSRDRHRRLNNGHTIQSVCGDIRVRGTVQAIIEKYKALASETSDRTDREMFLQHAEHYTRMQNERAAQHV